MSFTPSWISESRISCSHIHCTKKVVYHYRFLFKSKQSCRKLLLFKFTKEILKGALSGLRQFLAAESPLKVMKNAFYFTSKALFVLKMSKFLS